MTDEQVAKLRKHLRVADTKGLREHRRELIAGRANQSRDRSTLVTAGWHGAVRVWNATTRQLITSCDLQSA